MCEPASHASHNASHASHASQGASHASQGASHRFNSKVLNKEYYYVTAANTVQITVQIFSDIHEQFFVQ